MSHVYVAVLLVSVCCRAGDVGRGIEVLRREKCLICHDIHGEGTHAAPDLGKKIEKRYTQASMTSALWNHAPTMWTLNPPPMSAQDGDDLFAYFASVGFFDHPGKTPHEKPPDALRGGKFFAAKRCATCHNDPKSGAPKLPRGSQTYTPATMLPVRWMHGPSMTQELMRKDFSWPNVSAGDISNLAAFLSGKP